MAVLTIVLTAQVGVYADLFDSLKEEKSEEKEEDGSYTRVGEGVFEVTELREESVKHFRNADGSYTAFHQRGRHMAGHRQHAVGERAGVHDAERADQICEEGHGERGALHAAREEPEADAVARRSGQEDGGEGGQHRDRV